MKIPRIHLGRVIHAYLTEHRMKVKSLAARMGVSPVGLSVSLKKENMAIKKLIQISETLGHNFFEHYVPRADQDPIIGKLYEELKTKQKQIDELSAKNMKFEIENNLLRQIAKIPDGGK